MVTNVLAYSGPLLRAVLSVLLPHLGPLSSLDRYFEKVFSLESGWKSIIESSETEPSAMTCAAMYTAKVHDFVSLVVIVIYSVSSV